jgi:hypothetical protein
MQDQYENEIVTPNVANLITSLRDIGYNFEIAVADVLDNSISANARNIEILALEHPDKIVGILDDGIGMDEIELIEAMRLATQNPSLERSENDLGRFGLGLKTASFSQCKKLTVISKKRGQLYSRQWDLDFISKKNQWFLLKPQLASFADIPLLERLNQFDNGTLVIWQELDRLENVDFPALIDDLRAHLSLVFHRFLELAGNKKLRISINQNELEPFNPFNPGNAATQQINEEKIKIYDEVVKIQPYILPHHSKTSQQEFERYATEDGYTKSQGFYLYRGNRLLIHGTWWGLHKITDAHKLVRIKIDIPNSQDLYWGIDIKKSTAKPAPFIRDDLRRIIRQVVDLGSRPFTGRGKTIEDKVTKRFWLLKPESNSISFVLDLDHPILKELLAMIHRDSKKLLELYLKGIQAFLPLEAIQAQLNQNPHLIKQDELLKENDVQELAEILNNLNLDKDLIALLAKTEVFKKHKDLLGGSDE